MAILIVFVGVPVCYGAGSVWDFVDPSVPSGVGRLPDASDRLEIWDFWKGEGSVTGSLPLPGGRTASGGGSGPRGITDAPDTLEIWDFWKGEGNVTGSLPLPSGKTDLGGDSRPRGITDAPDTLEIWDFW
ncbi:MAG: hypothetical protein SWE60_18915, partial [Thermodesulfobacteriota bacterium]|nr:hypothetical protein [Thermodesulfobacteriota bacterium]